MRKKANEIDMLNGSLFKGLFVFSLPLIVTNLLQLLFNAADIVVVGKYAGDIYTAAVSSTTFVINIIINLAMGLSTGVNILIARLIGQGKRDKISSSIHTSLCFGFLLGILILIIAQFIAKPLLTLTNTPDEVIDLASTYMRIYFIGMPFNLIYNYGAAILRAKGDTKRPLYYLSLAGACNVILNIFMIVVFKMNVDGVAIGTVVSQFLSAVLIVSILTREKDEFKLSLSKLKIELEPLGKMVLYGMPVGLENSLFAISNSVLQSCINTFGTLTIAASGVSCSVESLLNGIMNGVQLSVLTFISQNYGAKQYKRIKKIVIIGILMALTWWLLFTLVTYFAGDKLLSLYTNSNNVIDIAYGRLKLHTYTYFMCCFMHIGSASLRGIGYSIIPTIVCLTLIIGTRLLMVWVIMKDTLTFLGVVFTYPVSWFVTSLVLWISLIILFRKDRNNI